MINTELLDKITNKLGELLPDNLGKVPDEIRKNIRQTLQANLASLDFVPRDEFDAQVKVLARMRQQLSALEKQLSALEDQLKD